MSLANWQQSFLDAITSRSNDSEALPSVSDALVQQGKLTNTERLEIYRHAYRARLTSVIDADFPALGHLLGDELYDDLVQAYIDTYPSQQASINAFGQHLPGFIRSHGMLGKQALACELCAFEWQLHCSFNAPDSPILDEHFLQTLQSNDWPGLRFTLHDSVAVRVYRYAVPVLWQSLKEAQAPEPNLLSELENPETWLIWRDRERITRFRSLSVDEACALNLAGKQASFAELCEALLEWHDEARVPAIAFSFLNQWLLDGVLREI